MNIYVIAGPPGVGKSSNAVNFIPEHVPIVDQDLAGYQYKKQGFSDYKDLASVSTNQKIRSHLFSGEDFALELNLGFQSHYDYLNSIVAFDRSNTIHLLLFFTDDIQLCLDRANLRFLSGGHEVKPEIIREMYAATIPLFQAYQDLFSYVLLINVSNLQIQEVLANDNPLPNWIVENNLTQYLT